MNPQPDPERRHAPPEARRAQILAAALHCFAEKGYHAARMDDLASAAGLSKGSLYWHFRSKEEVFLALFDAFAEEVFAAWDREAEHAESVLDLLRRQAELVIEGMAKQGRLLEAWIQFFAHPQARERFASLYRRSREKIASWLREGIARGEIRALPVDSIAAYLTGTFEGLLLQALVDPEFDAEAVWPGVWEAVERGIAP